MKRSVKPDSVHIEVCKHKRINNNPSISLPIARLKGLICTALLLGLYFGEMVYHLADRRDDIFDILLGIKLVYL